MPFWSSQTLRQRQTEVFSAPTRTPIKQGSGELRMGPQAAISGDGMPAIIDIEEGKIIHIPPGQFALLLTEEIVKIPKDTVAFISLKTKIKARGLVNVSGFHVDPGFEGRLKFWVYNAGSQDIMLQRGEPTFLIWFESFDQPVDDPYPNRDPSGQRVITAENIDNMQGKVCSPSALQTEVEDLKGKVRLATALLWILVAAMLGLYINKIGHITEEPKPTQIQIEVIESRPNTNKVIQQ